MPRATYGARGRHAKHTLSKELFELIEKKHTNLSVSVDVTTTGELLRIAAECGPYICMLKTHIDIINDFSYDETVKPLQQIAYEHDFFLFEDRKFADIGNTVRLQYSSGVYRIAEWADLTNCHSVPGDGVIEGLKAIGRPMHRGLLLLAEMSSKGTLARGEYAQATVEMAARHPDFVIGFIGQNRIFSSDDLLLITPGVALDIKGDAMGQQYRTPKDVIAGGSDVIIVGRGITGADNVKQAAQRYQEAGWNAYLESM